MNLSKHIASNLFNGASYVKNDYRGKINLSSNELRDSNAQSLLNAFVETIDSTWFNEYAYYPHFRSFIANSCGFNDNQVLLYPGSDVAIREILFILTSFSKQLIIQYPNYYNYGNYAHTLDIEVKRVMNLPWNKEAFISDLLGVLEETSESLLVLTNPCGISGQCLTSQELDPILSAAESNNHLVVIDEAYVGFSDLNHLDFLHKYRNLIIIRSFSKFPGMAGARLSVVFSSSEIIQYLEKLNPMNGISRVTLELYKFFLVNSEGLDAIKTSVIKRRKNLILQIRMIDTTIECYDTCTNFILIDFKTPRKVSEFLALTTQSNFIIKNMYNYTGYETCLRISLPDEDTVDRFLDLFKLLLQSQTEETPNKLSYE